jgi:hypothetical protein
VLERVLAGFGFAFRGARSGGAGAWREWLVEEFVNDEIVHADLFALSVAGRGGQWWVQAEVSG